MLRILILVILTESLVELFFKAAPLQGIRRSLSKITPFLRSEEQGHLLDCKYCVSVWVAGAVLAGAYFFDNAGTRFIAGALVVHRLSNALHVILSWIRDSQINMRLKR